MRSIKLVIFFILYSLMVLALFPGSTAYADDSSNDLNNNILYYFWGYCPTCSKPADHIGIFSDYPIEIRVYEVFYDQEGRMIYSIISEKHGIEILGFPTVVYENQYWLGFSQSVQDEIIDAIEVSLDYREPSKQNNIITFPLLGDVDLAASPIMLTTFIIAFLDGFNPCSLFVLTFLLAIIVHSASRKRIFIVGITFLLVTAAVYGLFILGILNIMLFAAQLFWIRNIISTLVIILGVVAIKDFIAYRQGLSFAIPDSYKNRYYKQVRKIFYTESVLPMIAATAIMALGIALIELPCTAGFPFVWTSIIAGLDLPAYSFIVLFLIYIITYLSVELVIFLLAVIRMRSAKMTEEKGRFLKLVGGSLMLVLGLILLIEPGYMESITGIVYAFAAAAGITIIMYLIKKTISFHRR